MDATLHGDPAMRHFPGLRRLFLILFFSITIVFPLLSQDLRKKVTLNMKEKPVSEILEEISRQTKIGFSYNPKALPVDRLVTVRARKKPVGEVLDEVLIPFGITYLKVEGHIVLKPGVDAFPAPQKPVASRRYTLSGYLRDKNTGEALIGANVYIKGTTTGVITNGYGFYSLTPGCSECSVVFSYMGYREVVREVSLTEDIRLSVEMEEERREMKEVEIVAGEESPGLTPLSEFRFSGKTLSRLPGFGGDLDIIRAMQAVPGIHTFGDGSALYYVRGGSCDQNLLLIDDVPVYNPSHLFGFFSAFSPDAINTVQVYKGDFPAKYGGRLSSVVDIKAKEGNMKRFGFSGNIGPYASSITLEGPVVKEKASFFISGRISTLNWLNNLSAFDRSFDFHFFDINAKLNYRLNDNNRFFLTFYTGRDVFSRYLSAEVNSLGIGWNNLAGTLRWNHIFTSRLFSNTTLNYSRYDYTLNLPQEQNGDWNSGISNLTLKTDFSWYLNPSNTVRSGAEVTWHRSNPGNVTLDDGSDSPEAPEVAQYRSLECVLYAANEQRIGSRWSLRYGIRLPFWIDYGPTDVYYFDANHQVIDTIGYGAGEAYYAVLSPEPRLNLQYQVGKQSFLRAGYSRTAQFLRQLTNATGPFTSLEVWAPCGPNIEPMTADQLAAGFFTELFLTGLNFSCEGYYKWFHDNQDYRDHANLLYNPLIEGELRFGKAWSYGVEVMLRKATGRLTGWIGYTWSRALVQTPGVNEGNTYPASYDHPNEVTVNVSWDDGKQWAFTANWIYMTGGAITTPVGFYYINGSSVPLYGEKNNDRLPAYHRLDLSAAFTFNKPDNRYRHSLAVTLYNAYGRLNPFSVSFNKLMDNNGDFVVPSDLEGSYGLVPTSISVAGIIPSINYIFRF